MPGAHDFVAQSSSGTVKRLLALDCVQDPGNLVRPCQAHCTSSFKSTCVTVKPVRSQRDLSSLQQCLSACAAGNTFDF